MTGAAASSQVAEGSLTDFSTSVSHQSDAETVVRLAFLSAAADGRRPFVRDVILHGSFTPVELLPAEAIIIRCVTTETSVLAYAVTPASGLLIDGMPGATRIQVCAASDAEAAEVMAAARRRCPVTEPEGTVELSTWHMGPSGRAECNGRRIEAPAWHSIQRNYPAAVRPQLDALIATTKPTGTGKLILWHGNPGTGKTTALRALMRAWAPWCSSQYIADPEHFFADPSYITDLLGRAQSASRGPTLTRRGDPNTMWRLIIAEDADEYLRASARRDAGAGLGRLLNLTDGIFGQGVRALVVLTTNEELHRLHPAVVRPGRCLAKVEFERFSTSEASAWLPEGHVAPSAPATLAELYVTRGDIDQFARPDATVTTGQYL